MTEITTKNAWVTATWLEVIQSRFQGLLTAPSAAERYSKPRQLYAWMREDILSARVAAGTRLPSSRQLWQSLPMGRNAVLDALGQLLADDLIESHPRRGLFVKSMPMVAQRSLPETISLPVTQDLWLSQRAQGINQQGAPWGPMRGPFAVGVPDLSRFPLESWHRYLNHYQKNPKLEWQGYVANGGELSLRQAIAEHLLLTRGIHCTPAQVIITANTQQSIKLMAELLADVGDLAIMESPGYGGAYAALSAAGLTVVPCPVDAEGLCVEARATAQWATAALCYITPSHQYPLGSVMSLARRQALLQLASQHDLCILEDDYDGEFRYAGPPLLSLYGLAQKTDSLAKVVYLGTFSKSLFPAVQIAYMVVPTSWVPSVVAWQARQYREPGYAKQAALAAWMHDGHFSRHCQRQKQRYQARSRYISQRWYAAFGDAFPLTGEQAGLHLCAHFPAGIDDVLIAQALMTCGIYARPLSSYSIAPREAHHDTDWNRQLAQRCQRRGLVIGFGDVDDKMLPSMCSLLVKTITQAIANGLP
ncbi:PLP-dependent aminotransferase family protein [Parvibium lacunae]|uniref:PLP-dependent aminotransferase family protein n=1 Tax=Parvibium lacunae TaxID=1888893 RepID=A0A368L398_9BURK|nr:PLP-dependent aminotransferase family protein [Parvibium lacunae]RCS58049.1 PLP-dependent aminotransferase family protein [Parvibium lacunae]